MYRAAGGPRLREPTAAILLHAAEVERLGDGLGAAFLQEAAGLFLGHVPDELGHAGLLRTMAAHDLLATADDPVGILHVLGGLGRRRGRRGGRRGGSGRVGAERQDRSTATIMET